MFNLPRENYWNDNEQLTELRETINKRSSTRNLSNYALIVILYENGEEITKSLIAQFVYKKGKLSEKQLNLFADMLMTPMLFVTSDYAYERRQENKYISIQPTKAELKHIKKTRAEFGERKRT